MFPDLNIVDYVMVLVGGFLCFKKVAEMERYYNLRVVILCSIVGAILLLFLVALVSALDDQWQYDCYYEGTDHFTVSER